MKIVLGAFSVALAFVIVVGCSDDKKTTEAGDPPSCAAIVEACHPLDKGTGPIHDCHEAAEAEGVTEATCAAKKTECLSTCKADGGA
jgi:hypothetical protein